MLNYRTKNLKSINSPTEFRISFKLMHWLMAILFLLVIATVEIKERVHGEALHHELMWIHVQCGIALFFLIWLRIAMRILQPYPPITPPMHKVHHAGALLAHAGLYLFSIAIPLLGIIALQTRGVNVQFLGMSLPVIISEQQGLKYSLALISFHRQYGNYLIYLIAAHIVFAFLHHYLWKDDTLTRMLLNARKREKIREF